ncbi:Lon protease family protein [Sulfuritalea hydrogenivorans]|uniref:endopeptidase La n=1 Tax=Sulfuritalea hydrogenivorans sk43H TaxID=1223802 RepID=W0SHC9_9PROT|nr:ATP-binding protein [Sulfuritalea hydrogenivorans]BAO30764.1 putative ATP-dependent protease [Sulfuritalea hydrogenivorans sk43H]
MNDLKPLDTQALYRHCDSALLDFETSDQLPPLDEVFGQARAVEALRFAIDIARPGYNLFVLGEPGSSRHDDVRELLQAKAASLAAPVDCCYVNNFADAQTPRILTLPAGRGADLRRDMQRLIEELEPAISAAFDSEDFRTHAEAIQNEFKERETGALNQLGDESRQQGIALVRTPQGFAFAPLAGEEPMAPDVFAALADEEKQRLGHLIGEFGERLQKLLHQFPRWRREMQGRLKQLGRDTMSLAIGHLIDELKERYAGLENVLIFLDEVLADIVEYGESLREQRGDSEGFELTGDGISVQRYQVNLLVDNGGSNSAPIVVEDNPTYPNLLGRVDHMAHMGTLVTNFTLIKAGALHRANGGFLMLDADKILRQPFAWEALKRTLKAGEIRIESLERNLGFASALPLVPAPVALSCKVVLFGEPLLYYLLKEYDPEFSELFRVAADFETDVERSDDSTRRFARRIGDLCRRDGLRPFQRDAVARVIEQSARFAGDAERLTTNTRHIAGLLHEADHCAGRAGRAVVGAEDVEEALAAQTRRHDRMRDHYQQAILKNTLLITSSGGHVGQINGLAVIDLGDFRFAHPVRITATVRVGEGDVIDIERETEMGGPIHSKGVMILSSFLATRYSSQVPLSLSASLVFEQSYGPVEGDSASLAELCALLSALSGAPIDQSLAITGSVNQFGLVQAIGGVNEKIEGFFDICRLRGLTGRQGVLIPDANLKHLMLRKDVVAACAEGKFRIHAVASVEQAIELLTGIPAGEPDDEGAVPEGSINYLVATRMMEMSQVRQSFAGGGKRKRRPRKEADGSND